MTADAVPALEAQVVAVQDLIDSLSPEEWATASDCDGWRVQDVVNHMALVYQTIVEPGSVVSTGSDDAEVNAAVAVDSRRDASSEEVAAAYAEWSAKGVAALAALQDPPMADAVVPLGNLGSHPLHLLANAIVFDHYCHLRHDILQPGGPIARPALPEDPAALEATMAWMLAGLPQMCAEAMKVLDRPVNLVFEGAGGGDCVLAPGVGGGLVTITEGLDPSAAATVTTTAHAFVSWGTKRRDWRDMGVTVSGDETYAAEVLDGINII